jgi:glyoxylase-like metal-dependent hydrolase (beta-lactamase superfamily II)
MRIQKYILTILGIILLFPTNTFSQVKKIKYEHTQLSDHAYIITRTGSSVTRRSNMGVIIGEKGLLLINPLFRGDEASQFMKALEKISDMPIKYVINSNWDNYNTAANWYFKDKDVLIISHENVVYHRNIHTQFLFKDKFSLDIGTESIIAYKSMGHSFGHINIHLKNANTTFMADSFRSQWMTIEGPFGLDGHFKGIDMALEMGDEHTKYISGNTTGTIISNREDLINEKKLRSKFSNRVFKLKQQGKSNKEILMDNVIVGIFKQYDLYQYITDEIADWVINPLFYDEKAKASILSSSQLEKYVGTYSLKGKSDVEIFIENSQLFSKSVGQFYLKLVPTSETHFWPYMQSLNVYQIFEIDKENKVLGFTLNHGGATLKYTKK